jgi:uncharacterized protein (DUF1697 family)
MKKQKIQVEIVPLKKQRYETLGDYYEKAGVLHFKITNTGNPFYNKLILIHELIEQTLTEAMGIKESTILRHDLEFEKLIKDGKVDPDAEPGEHKNSPYRREHILAETVERLMLNHLNLETYAEYNKKLFKVFPDAND